MPRHTSIWKTLRAIKILRWYGFENEEIADILKPDIYLKELSTGEIVEVEGDRTLIDFAYQEEVKKVFYPQQQKKGGKHGNK